MIRHIAHKVSRREHWAEAVDRVSLDYDGRFLRRRTLTTASGATLHVDLPETVSLEDGDAFCTTNGVYVAILALPEPLLEIAGAAPALIRVAWHIGNRHTPAQVEAGRILIRDDPVMADMLARLGAAMRRVEEPFNPEGGAYGFGRTHGHHHGPATGHPHDDDPTVTLA